MSVSPKRRFDHDTAWIACPFDANAKHLADALLGRVGIQPCLTPDRDDIGSQGQPSRYQVTIYNSLIQ